MTDLAPHPRIAVIGLGKFGREHLRAYLTLGVQVVAVADQFPGRAELVAKQHGVGRWFTTGTELLERCDLDGVSIAVDPVSHVSLAIEAARRGVRVLLEKPIAASREAADRLLEAGVEDRVLPAHVLRFDPTFEELRQRVRAGEVGTVTGISARRDRASWHADHYAATHPALLTTIHDIDLAMWISGSSAMSVVACSPSLKPPATGATSIAPGAAGASSPRREAVNLLFAQVQAVDGTIWSLRTSWLLPPAAPPSDRFEVYGTDGVAVVDVGAGRVTLAVGSPHEVASEVPTDPARALVRELQYFLGCVETGRPFGTVTLAEAHHAIAVSTSIVESITCGGARVAIGSERRT